MRLALALHCPTVRAMKRQMSAREYAMWLAYDRVEPIGGIRDDFRIASLQSLIYTIHKKPEAPVKAALDFMPFMPKSNTPELTVMSDDEIKMSLFRVFGV